MCYTIKVKQKTQYIYIAKTYIATMSYATGMLL